MLEHTNSQSEAVLERFNSVLTPPLAGRRGVGRAVQGAVPRQVMPSLFKWLYQPFTKDDEPDVIPIEQRVYSGDMIIYEGEHGRLDKLVGGRGQAHRRGGMQSRSSCCKPGPEARSRACQKRKKARPGPAGQNLTGFFGLSPAGTVNDSDAPLARHQGPEQPSADDASEL